MHVSFNGILFGGKIASYLLAGEWRTRLGGASTHCLEAQQAFSKSIPENVWTVEQNQKWRPDFCTDSVNWKALRIIEIQGDRMTIWESIELLYVLTLKHWECSQWMVSGKQDEWIRAHGKNRCRAQHIIHIHAKYQYQVFFVNICFEVEKDSRDDPFSALAS